MLLGNPSQSSSDEMARRARAFSAAQSSAPSFGAGRGMFSCSHSFTAHFYGNRLLRARSCTHLLQAWALGTALGANPLPAAPLCLPGPALCLVSLPIPTSEITQQEMTPRFPV